MPLRNTIVGILLFFLLLSDFSTADSLVMQDGSVLKGQIIRQEKNTLEFKTVYAGTIKIKWDQVKTFQTDEPVTIMLVTDELISTRYVSNDAEGISKIKKEGEDWKTAFKTHNVAFINPDPWRLNQGYKISARADVAIKSQHGNTVKDELDMSGRLEFRSLNDRYNFYGKIENDTTEKQKSADNWKFGGKYDRFFTRKRYYGLGLSFERDKFADLDLKTTIGPHIGHQFYESDALNLRSEFGFSKVYENNIDASDYDYLALNWHIDYDQYFFDKTFQFYHNHIFIKDLEKQNKLNIDSWTGVRFPMQSGIVASFELELEYDSKPVETVGKTDTTYRFKLGYQW